MFLTSAPKIQGITSDVKKEFRYILIHNNGTLYSSGSHYSAIRTNIGSFSLTQIKGNEILEISNLLFGDGNIVMNQAFIQKKVKINTVPTYVNLNTHHHITLPDKHQQSTQHQSTQPQLTQSDFNSLSPQEQYEYINPQLYLHSQQPQQPQQQSLKSSSTYPQLYQQKQQQSIKSPSIYPQLYHQEQQQQQLQQFPNLQKQPEAPRIIKHKKGKVSKFLNIFKRKTKKHFMDINTNSRFKTNKTNKTKHITPRKKTKKRNIFRKILNKFKRKKKISKLL